MRLPPVLTEHEMAVERTPSDLARWVEMKFLQIKDHPDLDEPALLHKGLFKKFYEEMHPLSLLVNRLYSNRFDVGCILNFKNKDFDAVIRDRSVTPPRELKVEFTWAALSHNEHLRMKYLLEHGEVNLFGEVRYTGTKRTGHQIEVEDEAIKESKLLEELMGAIKEAAEKKAEKPGKPKKYGRQHCLVIVFDDYGRFDQRVEGIALENFMKSQVLILPLNFGEVSVLGISGETFISFPTDVGGRRRGTWFGRTFSRSDRGRN